MKTPKIIILLGGLVSALVLGPSSFAQNAKYGYTPAVDADLARISSSREVIKTLEGKCDNYRKSGNEASLVQTKNDLAKAKADLKRDQAYLRTDKRALLDNYELAINARKNELKKDKADRKSYREKLDKSLAAGDEEASTRYAAALASSYKETKNDEVALRRAIDERDKGLQAINEQSSGIYRNTAGLYSDNVAAVKNINFNRLSK